MKKCFDCGGICKQYQDLTKDGLTYNYYKCIKCGEDVLDIKQLHEVAEKYRQMKKHQTKVRKWGLSLQ